MPRFPACFPLVGLLPLLWLAGCDREPRPGPPLPRTELPALAVERLGELTYPLDYVDGGQVRLEQGVYESAPDPLAGTRITVRLSAWTAVGDLDGDGQPDSAVVLVTDTGGSGVFYDLAVVQNLEGAPGAISLVHMGDRIHLKSLKIRDGAVWAELVEAGPDDPACCPSQRVTQQYRLQGEQLLSAQELPATAG